MRDWKEQERNEDATNAARTLKEYFQSAIDKKKKNEINSKELNIDRHTWKEFQTWMIGEN